LKNKIKKLDKSKRKMFCLSIIIFLIGIVFNVYLSAMIDQALTSKFKDLSTMSYLKALSGMFTNFKQFQLFLLFQASITLLAFLLYATSGKHYKSKLIQVTPDISIPASAGQKQFGSARFMTDEEKDKFFENIEFEGKIIKELVESGKDDLQDDESIFSSINRELQQMEERASGEIEEESPNIPEEPDKKGVKEENE